MSERVSALSKRFEDSLPGHVVRHGLRIDVSAHTLALAAQQVLCTGPLLVAISAISRRYHSGGVVPLIATTLGLEAKNLPDLLTLFRTSGMPDRASLLIGAIVSLAFMTSTAATTQRMLERVWGVERAPLGAVWRQLLWTLATVPGALAAMGMAHLVRTPFRTSLWALTLTAVIEGLCAFGFFWWTQHLLLRGEVAWGPLLPGSAWIGIGVGLAVVVSHWTIPAELHEQVQDYGPIGAAFVLSVWVICVTAVVVGGALLGAVQDERARMRRGLLGPPQDEVSPRTRALRGAESPRR